MASTSRANNEAAKWTQSEQDYLLKLMVEQVKVGNKSSSTFNKGGWNNIKNGLEEKFNRSFTMVQLRNKMNKMRFDYSAFKRLLDTTGFGWNSVTRTCTVEDDSVWDVHIKLYRMGSSNSRASSSMQASQQV
ncbi:uncharacterized protein LOC122081681 [Macadamia integrifolia]|uniref:uncharacterized protein LOC122081681 n=1 Tax=Macadamia integrifolia TaxID=60698 RepID=UPI001C4FFEA9|nr:uncharacterized protein LOC122081681 [Macadamia integrifolia]